MEEVDTDQTPPVSIVSSEGYEPDSNPPSPPLPSASIQSQVCFLRDNTHHLVPSSDEMPNFDARTRQKGNMNKNKVLFPEWVGERVRMLVKEYGNVGRKGCDREIPRVSGRHSQQLSQHPKVRVLQITNSFFPY